MDAVTANSLKINKLPNSTEAKTTLTETKTTLTEAKTTLTETKTTLTEAKTTLTETKTTLTEAKTTLTEAKIILTEAKTILTEAKTTLTEAKTTLTEAKTALTEAKTVLTEAKTALTETKTALTETKTTLTEAKTALAETKTALTETKTTLTETKTTLTEPKTTLTEPKTTLTEPKTTLTEPKMSLSPPKLFSSSPSAHISAPTAVSACILILLAVVLSTPAFSRTLSVCPACECTSISSALLEAQNGDVVLIKSGTYKEGNIIIEKEVELRGENYPVIDGERKGEIITVRSRNVKISGLQIQNVGSSFSKDLAAIKLERVKNCVIENNKVLAGYFGIYLGYAQQCAIRNNYIEGEAVSEFSSANAIHLWNCRGITITDNVAIRHRDGIYLEFSDDCMIENNVSEKNVRYGLHFMFSDNDIYRKNIFRQNQAGVAVMYSHDITMTENEFSHNWGAASYGLLLKEIKDSKIFKNRLSENTTGIYAEGCVRIHIENNNFENNGWALKISGNCDQNVFTGNNFLSNSFELGTNARSNMNRYEKNFWSKYSGYDLDKNGIGDVPHNPVDLFTYLVEQQPVSIILMRSLFIDLLNLSEKVNPMLTPTAFNDSQPMMQPVKW